jgi:hypothetical protein
LPIVRVRALARRDSGEEKESKEPIELRIGLEALSIKIVHKDLKTG